MRTLLRDAWCFGTREPLTRSLPRDTEDQGDVVPRPAVCSGNLNCLAEPRLVGSLGLRRGRDCQEVVCVVRLDCRRVWFVGALLEAPAL